MVVYAGVEAEADGSDWIPSDVGYIVLIASGTTYLCSVSAAVADEVVWVDADVSVIVDVLPLTNVHVYKCFSSASNCGKLRGFGCSCLSGSRCTLVSYCPALGN